jgi:phospholipid/cholesterol/gamma-HCH transport system substrate-binding protein
MGHSNQFLHPNDTLQSKMETDLKQQVGEQLAPIKSKAEKLMVSLDSIVSSTGKIMNPETQKDITTAIDQLGATMTNLNHLSADLSDIIGNQRNNLKTTISNLSATAGNLKRNSEQLNTMMQNFSNFSDTLSHIQLNRTFRSLNNSVQNLDQILGKIQSSEGTIGMLVNDPSMYQNLNTTIENLRALLIDLKQNPKRYVHFSAISMGRNIVVNPSSESQEGDSVIFKVQLMTSKNPVPTDSSVFEGITDVEEVKTGKNYSYYTGNETSFEQIRAILHKVQSAFPEATLKAFQRGKEINLKKALKSLSK